MIFKNDIDFLEMKVIRRNHPNSDDYWDGNWLYTEINILVGGFKANYYTNLRAEELHKFYQDLTLLYNYAVKDIEFVTLEKGIYLKFKSQSNGLLDCEGVARCGVKNSLNFELVIESEALKNGLFQLQDIIKQYPMVGSK